MAQEVLLPCVEPEARSTSLGRKERAVHLSLVQIVKHRWAAQGSKGSRACRRTYYIALGGPSKLVYLVSKFNDVLMACGFWAKFSKVAMPFLPQPS